MKRSDRISPAGRGQREASAGVLVLRIPPESAGKNMADLMEVSGRSARTY